MSLANVLSSSAFGRLVRFSFARDASGRVSSLTRMIYGSVNSWPHVP